MIARGAALVFALAAPLLPASAQTGNTICSVFDGKLCTPTFCSVFDPEPCIPDVQYPIGQDLRLTIDTSTPPPQKPDGELNTIAALFQSLRACFVPPEEDKARAGLDAVTSALARCTPLHFTKGMAGAIAGRPIAIRYVENRELRKSEARP